MQTRNRNSIQLLSRGEKKYKKGYQSLVPVKFLPERSRRLSDHQVSRTLFLWDNQVSRSLFPLGQQGIKKNQQQSQRSVSKSKRPISCLSVRTNRCMIRQLNSGPPLACAVLDLVPSQRSHSNHSRVPEYSKDEP